MSSYNRHRKKKKYGKKKKANKRGQRQARGYDHHHIFFPRYAWDANRWSRELRKMNIVLVPVETVHHGIHAEVPYVPLPSEEVCESVVKQIRPSIDWLNSLSFSNRLAYLSSLFDGEPEVCHALQRQCDIARKFQS